jgi:hypothetical protein
MVEHGMIVENRSSVGEAVYMGSSTIAKYSYCQNHTVSPTALGFFMIVNFDLNMIFMQGEFCILQIIKY